MNEYTSRNKNESTNSTQRSSQRPRLMVLSISGLVVVAIAALFVVTGFSSGRDKESAPNEETVDALLEGYAQRDAAAERAAAAEERRAIKYIAAIEAAEEERRAIEYAVALEAAKAEEERLAAERLAAERLAAERAAAAQAAAPTLSSSPAPPAPAVSGDSVWDALAQCESGGNWSINTGNGFYGGIQFMHQTWVNMGGRQYAEYPHQASREQQIEVATRLQAQYGWGQWPACSSKLGLR